MASENLEAPKFTALLPEPDWDVLRKGILIAGTYKILERVPRWVGRRRFRAQSVDSDEERMLIFFNPSPEQWQQWESLARILLPLGDPHLLTVIDLERMLDFHFVVARWSNGVVLADFLNENGPASAETARSLVIALARTVRRLGLAELPIPSISPQSILIEREGSVWKPILFPLPLQAPSKPSVSESHAAASLRGLLFTLCTGLEAPAEFQPRHVQLLPEPVQRLWSPLFKEAPDLELLESVLGNAIPSELPHLKASNPLPPAKPISHTKNVKGFFVRAQTQQRMPLKTPPKAEAVFQNPFTSQSLEPSQLGRPVDPWSIWINVFGSLIAAFGIGFVAWFAYTAIQTLRDEPAESEFRFLVETPPVTAPLTKPPGTPEERTNDAQAPTPVPATPMDMALAMCVQYTKHPTSPTSEAQLATALAAIADRADFIRAGNAPQLLKALEEASAAGSPSASLLLAQVLWGRETDRSEGLFIRLARQGNPVAIQFCEDHYIEWKEK